MRNRVSIFAIIVLVSVGKLGWTRYFLPEYIILASYFSARSSYFWPRYLAAGVGKINAHNNPFDPGHTVLQQQDRAVVNDPC